MLSYRLAAPCPFVLPMRVTPEPGFLQLAQAALERDGGARDASGYGESLHRALRELERAVGAVVGQTGVAALTDRSLHLARPSFPWLNFGGGNRVDDLASSITASVATQDVEAARAASTAILVGVAALLAKFLGEALARQLLQKAWPTIFNLPAAPEKKS